MSTFVTEEKATIIPRRRLLLLKSDRAYGRRLPCEGKLDGKALGDEDGTNEGKIDELGNVNSVLKEGCPEGKLDGKALGDDEATNECCTDGSVDVLGDN